MARRVGHCWRSCAIVLAFALVASHALAQKSIGSLNAPEIEDALQVKLIIHSRMRSAGGKF